MLCDIQVLQSYRGLLAASKSLVLCINGRREKEFACAKEKLAGDGTAQDTPLCQQGT